MKFWTTAMPLICIVLTVNIASAQPGADIIKQMHGRYSGKWYHTFTFNQTTDMYKNDSLKKSQVWYEAVKFPDKFRIDFGEVSDGNAALFSKDSSYNFRKGNLVRRGGNDDDLTFVLGGMYFYPLTDVLDKLRALHYDLDKSFKTAWHGQQVYVIGATDSTEKVNQLWVDQGMLVLVRQLKYENGRKEDGQFLDHIKLGDGYTETTALFYFDDHLIQAEHYHDCKANVELKDILFDPAHFGEWHWTTK